MKAKESRMHTIQLQVNDGIYNQIITSGVDIQASFDEFVAELIDDGYSAISKQEALKRVSDGVGRYQNQTGDYLDSEAYQIHISGSIASLRAKYANNQG
jgi:hypothetical protein